MMQAGVKAIKDERYSFYADVSPVQILETLLESEKAKWLNLKKPVSSPTIPSAERESGTNCSSSSSIKEDSSSRATRTKQEKIVYDQIVEFYMRVSSYQSLNLFLGEAKCHGINI